MRLLADAAARLTVVVPAHYEQDVIGDTLRALHRDVGMPFKAVVVHDVDEDPTCEVVRGGASEWPEASLLKNAYGRGAVTAIRTGLEQAATPLVCVFMADMSDDPKVIRAMVTEADAGASVVSASRYMSGGEQVGGPRLKGLLSRAAGLSMHWLTRIPTRDPTNSFRLYTREFLDTVTVESTGGFEVGIELTVKAYVAGRRVAEVPATWHDRSVGESKFQLRRWLPLYLRWYMYALVRAPLGFRIRRKTA